VSEYGSEEYRSKHIDYPDGSLQHHQHTCGVCDPVHNLGPPCSECDGAGVEHWGSWYRDFVSDCTYCKTNDVPVGRMFDTGTQHGEGDYVCFDCYVDMHNEEHPECNLFQWAEKR